MNPPAPESLPLSSGELRQVSKSHFKAHALELFRQVEASGEPLVVTDPLEPLRGSVASVAEAMDQVVIRPLLGVSPWFHRPRSRPR